MTAPARLTCPAQGLAVDGAYLLEYRAHQAKPGLTTALQGLPPSANYRAVSPRAALECKEHTVDR